MPSPSSDLLARATPEMLRDWARLSRIESSYIAGRRDRELALSALADLADAVAALQARSGGEYDRWYITRRGEVLRSTSHLWSPEKLRETSTLPAALASLLRSEDTP